jgi:hypothetical protein
MKQLAMLIVALTASCAVTCHSASGECNPGVVTTPFADENSCYFDRDCPNGSMCSHGECRALAATIATSYRNDDPNDGHETAEPPAPSHRKK